MNIDMTFTDKYKYATELNILNNAMRIASGLPISDFGIPKLKDPTKNDFELPIKQEEIYLGVFNQRTGSDVFVYFGVSLKIIKAKEQGLEAIIFRDSQVVNRFPIDFINASLAISRNIDSPCYLKFALSPQGHLSSVNFNGIDFIKSNEGGQKISLDGRRITFLMPLKWNVASTRISFEGSSKNSKDLLVIGGRMKKSSPLSIDSLKKVYFTKSIKSFEGNSISKVVGPYRWQQKSYGFIFGIKQLQILVMFTESSQSKYWLMLCSPKESATQNVQDVLNPLLLRFKIN